MAIGKMVDVLDSTGFAVCKVGPTVTSIGVELKAGFPVIKAIRAGRLVWVQNGAKQIHAKKQQGQFGTANWR